MKYRVVRDPISKAEVLDYTDGQEGYRTIRIDRAFLPQIEQIIEAAREAAPLKGSWTEREDSLLMGVVDKYGPRRWSYISQYIRGRTGKQCRERWKNHLDPGLDHTEFRRDEDCLIVRLHKTLGNQWAKIARYLTGRTPNKIKNRWNAALSKRCDLEDEEFEGELPSLAPRAPQPGVPNATPARPVMSFAAGTPYGMFTSPQQQPRRSAYPLTFSCCPQQAVYDAKLKTDDDDDPPLDPSVPAFPPNVDDVERMGGGEDLDQASSSLDD